MTIIDVECPGCGAVTIDQFVLRLDPKEFPSCTFCGTQVVRKHFSSAAITPNGTQPERRPPGRRDRGPDRKEQKAREKQIAVDTIAEIEQKWTRYSDPVIAEQHVSREINEAAGIADAQGNKLPIPKPAPLVLQRSAN